jgi:hypothetical protein
MILWVDEEGFYLLPMVVRTWAPRGQTPLLRVKLTHAHRIARSAGSRSMGACSCKYVLLPMTPQRWWASCAFSCGRFPARSSSSGMALLFTGLTKSKIFSSVERPSVYIWNNCRAMPRISTQMRASGIIEKPRRVGQYLLFRSRAIASQASSSQRTLEAQTGDHQKLFSPVWLLRLVH